MATGIYFSAADVKAAASGYTCDACALGKQHRAPFPSSSTPPQPLWKKGKKYWARCRMHVHLGHIKGSAPLEP